MGFAFFTKNSFLNLYQLGIKDNQLFEVVCVGGGGGGGSGNSNMSNFNINVTFGNGGGFGGGQRSKYNASGGSGGDIEKDYFLMNKDFSNVPIIVGESGDYASDGVSANGTNGGITSFGNYLSANGGIGGSNVFWNSYRVVRATGLTSQGGVPINARMLINARNGNHYEYYNGSAGGGGYVPGMKDFGGSPGFFAVYSGYGLAGVSGTNEQNASYYTSRRDENLKKINTLAPTQDFMGEDMRKTGVICIYW